MSESNLFFGVLGLPPASARNCIQELSPIPNGEFRRSINGGMLFLESTERRRYKSVISCKDLNTPIIEGIWIGAHVNIGCIQTLSQSIRPGEHSAKLIRPAVNGSINVVDKSGNPIKFDYYNDEVSITAPRKDPIFVHFCPWLLMQLIDFSMQTDEWGMTGAWKLALEEV